MNSTIPSLERYRQMCYKKNTFLFHFSLFIYDSFFSLFLFLLSFSTSLHLLSSHLSSFLFSSSFFLQNLHLSLFLAFFPPFFFFVTFSAPSLSFFFFPITLPLYLFFFLRLGHCHWDRPSLWSSTSPWSSASPIRSSPWRSLILISLFFFSFGCGFHVIVIMGELVLFQALFF